MRSLLLSLSVTLNFFKPKMTSHIILTHLISDSPDLLHAVVQLTGRLLAGIKGLIVSIILYEHT